MADVSELVWIPASAGMTELRLGATTRHSRAANRCQRHSRGSGNPRWTTPSASDARSQSAQRRPESTPGSFHATARLGSWGSRCREDGGWIPACAGMTESRAHRTPLPVIPAQAGIHLGSCRPRWREGVGQREMALESTPRPLSAGASLLHDRSVRGAGVARKGIGHVHRQPERADSQQCGSRH